jgi:hypothetical protein
MSVRINLNSHNGELPANNYCFMESNILLHWKLDDVHSRGRAPQWVDESLC